MPSTPYIFDDIPLHRVAVELQPGLAIQLQFRRLSGYNWFMKVGYLLVFILYAFCFTLPAQVAWQADLDSRIRFYHTTDFGIILAGTQKSLYAVDGQSGERIWRRESGRINESAVSPVPDTDLILFTRDLGDKSRLEAIDVLTGERIWQSDKVKGDVMQLAADPQNDLVAVVLVDGATGRIGNEVKRKPVVHVLRLSTGNELWKRELDGEVEMMPARFNTSDEVAFTLDNYRAPLLLDGRLYLFYEGSTSYDAQTGKEKQREKFKVNEDGLALTEADPVFDESNIYVSGRGRIRAIRRQTGEEAWKADDVGNAADVFEFNDVLYVRTGGQFTRITDGEVVSRGPYGVSAINASNGKIIWRYKGADKGLTNFVFADAGTILFADNDDLIAIDIRSGKRIAKSEHKIDHPQFVLLNEAGNAVVGGRDEIASFDLSGRELWRVRHKPPGRGTFAIVAGIALRATALYFRYGGVASSAYSAARGGLKLLSAANSYRSSPFRSHFGSFDLTTLASSSARNLITRRIYTYGSLARLPGAASRAGGLEIIRPSGVAGSSIPSRGDVQESVFDRLDPARQLDKLSNYLLHRRRLAELRGNYMYFFTDLAKPFNRKGLVGVNIHTGQDARFILNSDPDPQFVMDETSNLLYSADGNKLQAFAVVSQ
jgi:outer membrane protein assembly factor BamB